MAVEINAPGLSRWWSFILQLLAFAFTIWAGVVFWAARQVVTEVDQIIVRQDIFQRAFDSYVISMEHRVSVLEDGQLIQDSKRDRIERDVEVLKEIHEHQFHERR